MGEKRRERENLFQELYKGVSRVCERVENLVTMLTDVQVKPKSIDEVSGGGGENVGSVCVCVCVSVWYVYVCMCVCVCERERERE